MSAESKKATIYERLRFLWGAFVIATVVGILMIPGIILFRRHKGAIMHKLNRLILRLIGAKIEAVGTPAEDADIFVFNHQGIIDIIGMEALYPLHLRWAAKKELFEAPWYGLLLRFGEMISLDRENKAALISLFKSVKESREKLGRAVAIFPEGTRAKGQKLLPFKAGAKLVAEKLGLKVQPVVIIGSKYLLNEHDKTAHSGTVRYIFLDPIEVSDAPKTWFEEMRDSMQKVIDNELSHYTRSR